MPFVKVWTEMFNNTWFTGLTCNQRGVWFQLLLLAKLHGDSGIFCYRSVAALSSVCGCDRGNLSKILADFHATNHIVLNRVGKSTQIEIPNYIKWQELKVSNPRADSGNTCEKPRKSRPEQTRADKKEYHESSFLEPEESCINNDADTVIKIGRPKAVKKIVASPHSEIVEYFCAKYEQHYKFKYRFMGGRDGKHLKELLTRWKPEELKILINVYFDSENEFYENSGGRTIGKLFACQNSLAMEAKSTVSQAQFMADRVAHLNKLAEKMVKNE